MGKLCSKFGENRSIHNVTILSTDTKRTDGRIDGRLRDFYARQLYRQVLLRARISCGNSVCLSIRRSVWGVTTRYRNKPRWDIDSGFSPYDSLESLVSDEVIWCRWVMRFPSNEGIKEGTTLEIVILPLLARLGWERLQIDTDLLLIVTSTADELSGGTNIDDLERPSTPKIGVFSEFFAISGCGTHFMSELCRNHSIQTITTWTWNLRH